jgi:hypothetical protein
MNSEDSNLKHSSEELSDSDEDFLDFDTEEDTEDIDEAFREYFGDDDSFNEEVNNKVLISDSEEEINPEDDSEEMIIDKLPEWMQKIFYGVYWTIDDIRFKWEVDEEYRNSLYYVLIFILVVCLFILTGIDLNILG